MSRRDTTGKSVTFKLVHPSYEDRDYDERKSVLVPREVVERNLRKARDDEPISMAALLGLGSGSADDEDFRDRRNMHHLDDDGEAEDALFEDQEECEFGDDFLKEVICGDPPAGTSDEEDGYGEDGVSDVCGPRGEEVVYPKHDVTGRAIDRQFTKMMKEFDLDEPLNNPETEDPRVQGPLEVNQYLLALEEFVEDNAGVDLDSAQPMKNRGLINQLKYMAHATGAFDVDDKGVFMTTLLPDKQSRFMQDHRERMEAVRAEAKQRIQCRDATNDTSGMEKVEEGRQSSDDAESVVEDTEVRLVPARLVERHDCETIISTYSTLYNHPTVIAASSKRVDISAKARRAMAGKRRAEAQECEQGEKPDHDAREQHKQMLEVLSVRPRGETAEEKKVRRQAVKQMQREQRQQKKAIKEVYRATGGEQMDCARKSKASKAQIPLSLVRGSGA